MEKAEEDTDEILSEYHRLNRMSEGMAKAEFTSRLSDMLRIGDRKDCDDIIRLMNGQCFIKDTGNCISLFDFRVEESPEMKKMKERILKVYKEAAYEMPAVDNVVGGEKDKKNAVHIIDALCAEGSLVRLDHQYLIDRGHFEKALRGLKEHISENGKITLAEFRDMLGTSRKYAMAILDYLDREKITGKVDDHRILL